MTIFLCDRCNTGGSLAWIEEHARETGHTYGNAVIQPLAGSPPMSASHPSDSEEIRQQEAKGPMTESDEEFLRDVLERPEMYMPYVRAFAFEVARWRALAARSPAPSEALSAMFRVVAGALQGDTKKVRAYAEFMADKLDASGDANSARRLRELIATNASAPFIQPAAPSVEARDADADLWELGQAYIAFHDLCRQDASEAAINAALAHRNELQARIASLLPPEKT